MTADTYRPSQVQLIRTDEGYLIPIPADHYQIMEEYELSCPEDLLITRLFELGIRDVAYFTNTCYIHVDLRHPTRDDPRPIAEQIAEAARIKHMIDTFIDRAVTLADMLNDNL